MKPLLNTLSVGVALSLLAGCTSIPKKFVTKDQTDRKGDLVEGDTMYRIVPAGAIKSIDDPKWVTVERADKEMEPEEAVIVYQQDGETRIYSTWTLNSHEIVNDVVGETAIAVTW